MIYTLDFPPEVEASFYQDLKQNGDELPERMKNKPILKPGLALYFNAWFELDGERNRSEYRYIKRSDCFDYASDYGFNIWQTIDLWFFIRKMDAAFMAWYAKKHPLPVKGKKNGRTS